MTSKLIILRGPSGSGKSTIAKALQQSSVRDVLIIDQDYYRHTLLASRPDSKNIVPELIHHNTITALHAGYDVIIEGIFRKEKYLSMFERLMDNFDGETYLYYLDIGFEETVRRHATRDKSALFSSEEMQEWYVMAEPLAIKGEYHIPENSTQKATIISMKNVIGL